MTSRSTAILVSLVVALGAASATAADDGSVIDLMVVYTPEARANAGSTDAMVAKVGTWVDETNTALQNSGALFQFRLVHTAEVAYSGETTHVQILDHLQSVDGVMDEVLTMRDTYAADLVHLIVAPDQLTDTCGTGFEMEAGDPDPEAWGFSVSNFSCDGYDGSRYEIAHTLGHNFGVQHNPQSGTYDAREAGVTPALTDYAYGYVDPENRFRDIMAIDCPAPGPNAVSGLYNCPRVEFYSTSLETYNGAPVGDAQTSDAIRVMNDNRVLIANFRESTGAPTPTATPTPTASATPSATTPPTATPTASPTPGPSPTSVPPPARIEDTSTSVVYSGTWFLNQATVHSGGTAHGSVDPGSRATLTFSGSSVTLIAYKDEWSGIGRVFVDGALASTVDFYAATGAPHAQVPVWTASGLTAGTHTLAVEVTGTANTLSANAWIWVDAFDVATGAGATPTATPTPQATATTTTRVEDNDPSVAYTGTWFVNAAAVHSGGTAHGSVDAMSRATLAFTGSSVTVVAYKDEWSGIARIFIDGALAATVDCYAAPTAPHAQVPVYTMSGLGGGAHTIAVEVTGTANPSSGGGWIWLDAFDVTNP
jgi:hypothetical protein